MPRELMKSLISDERDSMNSDEEWAYRESESAMLSQMLAHGGDYRGRGGRGGRGGYVGKKKKVKKGYRQAPPSDMKNYVRKYEEGSHKGHSPWSYPVAPVKLDSTVLPIEKVSIARETKKLYAFCPNGSLDVIRVLFS